MAVFNLSALSSNSRSQEGGKEKAEGSRPAQEKPSLLIGSPTLSPMKELGGCGEEGKGVPVKDARALVETKGSHRAE